jgi:hypothetical protein
MEHNTLCGQKAEFQDVKASGTYRYHRDLEGYTCEVGLLLTLLYRRMA